MNPLPPTPALAIPPAVRPPKGFSPFQLLPLFLLLQLLAIPLSSAWAAPPPNDAFAGSTQVSGLPLQVQGTNLEATRQTGEPDPSPGNGGASVWWTWTAPSAGWIQINTYSSQVDTLLAVYTGSSLTGLTQIAFNDDAANSRQSRVKINATAGVAYHIQVQGYAGDAGNIVMAFTASTAPRPPVLQKLVVTPATADITNFEAELTAEITFTAPDTLQSLIFTLSSGTGDFIDVFPDAGELIPVSGSLTNGTWLFPVSIPVSRSPGPWTVSVRLLDELDEEAAYGGPGEPPLPAGSTPIVTLVNTGLVDANAPELLAATLTPNPVNVTSGLQSVTVRITAADDTGVDFISLAFFDEENFETEFISLFKQDLVSGTIRNGVWETTLLIPAFSAPGAWAIDYSLGDVSQRFSFYGDFDDPVPAGSSTSLVVQNTGPVDMELPTLLAFAANPAAVSLASLPASVGITVQAMDDTSLVSVNAVVEAADGDGYYLYQLTRTAGTAQNGTWTGNVLIDPEYLTGDYRIGVQLNDGINPELLFGTQYPDFLPLPAGSPTVITVTGAGPQDAYATWRAARPALAGPEGLPDADPDGDGLPNAVEFLCGTDPLLRSDPGGPDPDSGRAPFYTLTPTDFMVEYRLSAANASLGTGNSLTLQPQATANPAVPPWTPLTPVLIADDLWRAQVPRAGASRQFLRLVVP